MWVVFFDKGGENKNFVTHQNFKIMDTIATKQQIVELISLEVDEWLSIEGSIKDGYEYEEKMIEVARKVNRIILEKSMGAVSSNRNKKNFTPVLGKLK